jgi:hypothetical protein
MTRLDGLACAMQLPFDSEHAHGRRPFGGF